MSCSSSFSPSWCFPSFKRFKNRIIWYDYILALLGIAVIVYMLVDFDQFIYRSVIPNFWDKLFGIILILLVLEATRRTTGLIMPGVVLAFIVYAFIGPMLPNPWTHRGYDIDRIVGHMYMTLEGIFGVPIDVSSTFIILFTIWGAFLEFSGAGKFFIDFSFAAMGGKPTSAGRTVTLASFLLGGPSGSGVATTVTLGAVAYPMLAKAGYSKDAAGGLLSAGGIGAILSPPVLGAAAFLIAEFLKISYLDVIIMASIPTCLYYWSIFLMVELDAKKIGVKEIAFDKTYSVWQLTYLYGFHFTSLIAIVVIMLIGFTPIMAVFWSTIITFAVSFIRKDTALTPKKLVRALRGGSIGVLSVASTCAAAGIIVGVVTLTGLGVKVQFDYPCLCRRKCSVDSDLYGDDRLDHWTGCSGYGLLYYCCCHLRTGNDPTGDTRFCRPYVCLLLRHSFRGFSSDCSLAFCGGSPDWR